MQVSRAQNAYQAAGEHILAFSRFRRTYESCGLTFLCFVVQGVCIPYRLLRYPYGNTEISLTYEDQRCLISEVSVCGNKMPTRCNTGFYCRSYCLLNMFRASLCPSSGTQEYYTVVAACGILCCGFFK